MFKCEKINVIKKINQKFRKNGFALGVCTDVIELDRT